MIRLGFCGFVPLYKGKDGFAAKALRPEVFCFLSFYWEGKGTKPGVDCLSSLNAKISFTIKLLLKTAALAPIAEKILLCRGSAQKIEADSGK